MKKNIFCLMLITILMVYGSLIFADISPLERQALIAIYQSTDGDNWENNDGWKTPPLHTDGFAMPGTEGQWSGLSLSYEMVDGSWHVTHLYLNQNGLKGTLPTEIGNLTYVQYAFLGGNELRGSLPASIGNMSSLIRLEILGGNLSGSIPPELGNLSNMTYLGLQYNDFSGSIPPELGNASNLKVIDLSGNELTGNIPEELGNLSRLERINLSYNSMEGTVPQSFSGLSNLSRIYLRANKFSGSVLPILNQLPLFEEKNSDLSYNAFTDTGDFKWKDTQTTAPTELSAPAITSGSISLDWEPMPYIYSTGANEVYYSATSGGPWTKAGETETLSHHTYGFGGLTPDTTYYVVIRSRTDANNYNKNTVYSDYSEELIVTTAPAVTTHTLNVEATPLPHVAIQVDTMDNNGETDGTTYFSRNYDTGAQVRLTAPATLTGNYTFAKWMVNGTQYAANAVTVQMTGDVDAMVYYTPPPLVLNRNQLNFAAVMGGTVPSAQTFYVDNGTGQVEYRVASDAFWCLVSPGTGRGSAFFTVNVDITGLTAGTYSAEITVRDSYAGKTHYINVALEVKKKGTDDVPFGVFATPEDGAAVAGSIPVTGWVLDDTGVEHVKIYREGDGGDRIYIGDAVFVEGARPDVEAAYPDYPQNYRAGWGYMLLTNFLPNSGNGRFKLTAIATDIDGNRTNLGTRTIVCNNADSVKPFGAIDTPTQGGEAWGGAFVVYGWALTPLPNTILPYYDYIRMWVDGKPINNRWPHYGIYRKDIATLFPGYNNSDGAMCYFELDTTAYEDGLHNIAWVVRDDAVNMEGIGSRYFHITNNANRNRTNRNTADSFATADFVTVPANGVNRIKPVGRGFAPWQGKTLEDCMPHIVHNDHSFIAVQRGMDDQKPFNTIEPNAEGNLTVTIRELQRVAIKLFDDNDNAPMAGYMLSGSRLKKLPIGSTLERETNTFHWQPGAGFTGEYKLLFIKTNPDATKTAKQIIINIQPKQ